MTTEEVLHILGLTPEEFEAGYDEYDRIWMIKNRKHPPTAGQLAGTLHRVIYDIYQGTEYDKDCIDYAKGITK